MPADDTFTVAVEADTSGIDRALGDLSLRANAFDAALTGALKGAASGGRSLDGVLRQLGQRISSIALNAALKPLESAIGGLFGQAFSSLSGFLAGGSGGGARVTPFAKGGVVRAPSYFPNGSQIGLMGEAGAEAILPLKRGADGTLGVAAGPSGGRAAPAIVFNVSTSDAASFRRSEAQIQAMLARAAMRGQATTLAHCWRLTRTDGVVLGFTDHDEALVFGGTRFEAAAGLSAGEAETALGLGAGTQEVEGALSSLSIEEADIRAGRYDRARIETFLVDWQRPDEHLLLDIAEIGEVKRGGPAFTAELRGIASQLDRRRGRIYRRRCDAILGDDRCRVDTSAPHLLRNAALLHRQGAVLVVSGLAGAGSELFQHGHIVWSNGPAAGLTAEIAHIQTARDSDEASISLVDGTRGEPVPGDTLSVHAGCDKSFSTCRGRFQNGVNFRGFPHLPGNDAAMGFAKKDGLHDGSAVVP